MDKTTFLGYAFCASLASILLFGMLSSGACNERRDALEVADNILLWTQCIEEGRDGEKVLSAADIRRYQWRVEHYEALHARRMLYSYVFTGLSLAVIAAGVTLCWYVARNDVNWHEYYPRWEHTKHECVL